jgi:hypothetical protein
VLGIPSTITSIGDQITGSGAVIGPLAFIVDDLDTPIEDLAVSATTSNQALIPSANVVIGASGVGGSGASRAVTVTPAANQSRTATITLTVVLPHFGMLPAKHGSLATSRAVPRAA